MTWNTTVQFGVLPTDIIMDLRTTRMYSDIFNIIIDAVEHGTHENAIEKLKILKGLPDFENLLCKVLMNLQAKYVKIMSVPSDTMICQSYCTFFGKVFLNFTCENYEQYPAITDCILRTLMMWVCSRMGSSSVELQNACSDCLSTTLIIVGQKLQELCPARLNCILEIITDDVLSDNIPRMIKKKLLDILLKCATWQNDFSSELSHDFSSLSTKNATKANAEPPEFKHYLYQMLKNLNLLQYEEELSKKGITDNLLVAGGEELKFALQRTNLDTNVISQITSYCSGLHASAVYIPNSTQSNYYEDQDKISDYSYNKHEDRHDDKFNPDQVPQMRDEKLDAKVDHFSSQKPPISVNKALVQRIITRHLSTPVSTKMKSSRHGVCAGRTKEKTLEQETDEHNLKEPIQHDFINVCSKITHAENNEICTSSSVESEHLKPNFRNILMKGNEHSSTHLPNPPEISSAKSGNMESLGTYDNLIEMTDESLSEESSNENEHDSSSKASDNIKKDSYYTDVQSNSNVKMTVQPHPTKWPAYDQLCSHCGSTDHNSRKCPEGLKNFLFR